MIGDLITGVLRACWAGTGMLAWRVVVEHGWDDLLLGWVGPWWRRVCRYLGDDLPEVALWAGIVLIVAGVVDAGTLGAIFVAVGAGVIAVGVRAWRLDQQERMRRVSAAVAEVRHEAIAAAVRAEVGMLRGDLGAIAAHLAGRIEEAVEEILDEPLT